MDSLKMRDALDPISYQKKLEELSSYLPLYKKVDYALLRFNGQKWLVSVIVTH